MQKSLKRNFIISLIKTMIVSVTPIIIFPYAARILGTSGIGKVQYIQSVAGFFQIFASFGITTYGIREGAKLRDDNKKLGKFTTELILINLFTTILTLIMYSFLFKLEEFYQYKSLLILFAGYIFSYGMNLDWFFNAIEEYTYITKRTAIFYFIAILVMLFSLKLHKMQKYMQLY